MTELELKYGCNPNQKPARIFMEERELPLKVLNGRPGYINFMDALNSWQLVRALKKATGLPAAASAQDWAEQLWKSLNKDNKVSLYVSLIDLATGERDTVIVNKHG